MRAASNRQSWYQRPHCFLTEHAKSRPCFLGHYLVLRGSVRELFAFSPLCMTALGCGYLNALTAQNVGLMDGWMALWFVLNQMVNQEYRVENNMRIDKSTQLYFWRRLHSSPRKLGRLQKLVLLRGGGGTSGHHVCTNAREKGDLRLETPNQVKLSVQYGKNKPPI